MTNGAGPHGHGGKKEKASAKKVKEGGKAGAKKVMTAGLARKK